MSVTLIDLQREQMAHAETKKRLEAAMAENAGKRGIIAENVATKKQLASEVAAHKATRDALAKLQIQNANMQTKSKRAIVDPKGDAVKIAMLTAECDKLRRELDAKG